MDKVKAPVGKKAFFARLERRLGGQAIRLVRPKSPVTKRALGDIYLVDLTTFTVTDFHVTPEQLNERFGILHPWEVYDDSEP